MRRRSDMHPLKLSSINDSKLSLFKLPKTKGKLNWKKKSIVSAYWMKERNGIIPLALICGEHMFIKENAFNFN